MYLSFRHAFLVDLAATFRTICSTVHRQLTHPVLTAAAAVLLESDISAATLDAPWNHPEQRDGFSETARPGLGCTPLPDFEYPEDGTAGLGSQAKARPLYER